MTDMVFHQFAHKAVDGTTCGSEALERLRAGLVFRQGAKNAFELADNFLGARDEVELFARGSRHSACIP